MTPDFEDEYRRRQRARARVTGWILGALVVLFFAIAIARMVH
jgi:nitrogen fixation protein FixH